MNNGVLSGYPPGIVRAWTLQGQHPSDVPIAVRGAPGQESTAVGIRRVRDLYARFTISSDGTLAWGDGTAATDTSITRSAAAVLTTTASMSVGTSSVASGSRLTLVGNSNSVTPCTDVLTLKDNTGSAAGGPAIHFMNAPADSWARIYAVGGSAFSYRRLHFQTNGSVEAMYVDVSGNLVLGAYLGNGAELTNGRVHVPALSASRIPIVAVGASSQTADLQEWQNSSSAVLLSVLASGQIKTSSGLESTGAGSAALGANSPASTLTAPYTWLKFTSSDGSQVYVPAWK